jgi:hypothetical protein
MAVLFDPFSAFSVLGLASDLEVGAKLYWYAGGTTTPIATHSDRGLTTPNANPVVSDANGRFPQIWLADGTNYKWVLTDVDGVLIKSQDDYQTPSNAPGYDADLADFLAGDEPLPIASGGTGATSEVDALAALGGMGIAGGPFDGQITRTDKGGYLFNAAGAGGEVFLQAIGGAAPTMANGDWLAEY